jgi:transcription-repair coupling factor (superfamily II helicase)
MYCQLLENAVRKLKQQPLRTPLDVTVDLPWPAFLPRDYVPGQRLKIEVYRRLARLRRLERLEDFRQELRDRFGEPPEPALWLLRLAELRLLAARWQIGDVHLEGKGVENAEFAVWNSELRKHGALDRDGKVSKNGPVFGTGPVDLVFGYRNPRRMERLAKRSGGRLRIVDSASAYLRLQASELEPAALYAFLKQLLRPVERSV